MTSDPNLACPALMEVLGPREPGLYPEHHRDRDGVCGHCHDTQRHSKDTAKEVAS